MRTKQHGKIELLNYAGLDSSDVDRWLRDRVADLFDAASPTPLQSEILHMADLRLTLMDLPDSAYPNHKKELFDLARHEARLSGASEPPGQ